MLIIKKIKIFNLKLIETNHNLILKNRVKNMCKLERLLN